jgi:flavin reductase (DIM6/NTAB) family NADH-FMN oxidoreductase RutF
LSTRAAAATRVDPAQFKKALAQFASGVTVVTTVDAGGRPLGLTVSAFCSVSLEPALVLACVDNRSATHEGFRASGVFGVSVLAEGQEAVSRRFAGPGTHRFAGFVPHQGAHGVPLVPGALVHMVCRVVSAHVAGDHTIYVGEVLGLDVHPGRPLVYHGRSYRRLAGDP